MSKLILKDKTEIEISTHYGDTFVTVIDNFAKLDELKGCEAHSSVILSGEDQHTLAKLGINLTCEPKYQTKKLFHN